MISQKLRNKLFRKYGEKCSVCGRVGVPLEIGHIISITKGGTDTFENLQVVCRSCHALIDKVGVEPDEAREIASSAYLLEIQTAEILKRSGFAVVSGVTGPDAGVDIIARDKNPITGERRVLLIECKAPRRSLSKSDVAAFAAKLLQYAADLGVIVSNKEATKEALDTAQEFGLSIITKEKFADFVKNIKGGGSDE